MLDFLKQKKNDIHIKSNYSSQLKLLEEKILKSNRVYEMSSNWDIIYDGRPGYLQSEEVLLTNTYLNTVPPLVNNKKEIENEYEKEE